MTWHRDRRHRPPRRPDTLCSRGVEDGAAERVPVAGQVGAHGDDGGTTQPQLAGARLAPGHRRPQVLVAGSGRHEHRHVEADDATAVQRGAGARPVPQQWNNSRVTTPV